jgi:FkbM family methyltransferase
MVALAASAQSPKRRAMTLARLTERLDARSAHTVTTDLGPLRTLPQRGPHLAAAALGFDDEEPETLAWIRTFAPGEVFYDIGAATGLFSMYAALKEGTQVFAIEPKGTSFGVLIEHLALNGLGARVFPLCVALSDVTEATRLTLSALAAGSGGNSLGGAPDQFGLTRSVFEQGALAYRLDDLIATFRLPPPTHLKIDVDGIEGVILRGAPLALGGARSVMIEVEGENARLADERIAPLLTAAGLAEAAEARGAGSGRNRLFRRS